MRCQKSRQILASVVAAIIVVLVFTAPADAEPTVGNGTTTVIGDVPVTTTTTAPLPDISQDTSSSSPGLFDVSGHVRKAINDWFESLVTSAVGPVLDLLGRVLLSAPDLTGQADVHGVWEVTVAVADALFVVFALIGGVIVMTHETVQSRYSLKEIAPRLVLAVITANISLIIISQAIALANGLAQGLLGDIDPAQAVNGLGKAVLASAALGDFLILLSLVATVMAIMLVCLGLIRAVLVVLLIVSAPLALACHALPQTDQIAFLWWRSLAACLSIQVAQALVLVTAIRVIFVTNGSLLLGNLGTSGFVDMLLVLCVFWIMLKIPAWAEKLVFTRGGGPINSAHQKAWVAAKLAVKFA